jgi:very-short-patch-repair endonuclease
MSTIAGGAGFIDRRKPQGDEQHLPLVRANSAKRIVVMSSPPGANVADAGMEFQEWLRCYRSELGGEYELLFAEQVLAKLEHIDFATITPQYAFRDLDGRQRYCDFALQEGQSVKIAIEADGYDKRGTGAGMSKADFVDWQRRQAALASQGWSVLRFANTDIRDYPERCLHHIELLLRRQRAQERHQAELSHTIERLTHELRKQTGQGTDESRAGLEHRIKALGRQLNTKPLSTAESRELDELTESQNKVTVLTRENNTMRTTIWAFTFIIVTILIAAVVVYTSQQPPALAAQRGAVPRVAQHIVDRTENFHPSAAESSAARSASNCKWSSNIFWDDADTYVGCRVTTTGPVKRVTTPINVKGDPTFITIGVADTHYPDLTAVIWGSDKPKFQAKLAKGLGTHVTVSGVVRLYRGRPEIVLRSADQLSTRATVDTNQ